jgi:hypothetical protein
MGVCHWVRIEDRLMDYEVDCLHAAHIRLAIVNTTADSSRSLDHDIATPVTR